MQRRHSRQLSHNTSRSHVGDHEQDVNLCALSNRSDSHDENDMMSTPSPPPQNSNDDGNVATITAVTEEKLLRNEIGKEDLTGSRLSRIQLKDSCPPDLVSRTDQKIPTQVLNNKIALETI